MKGPLAKLLEAVEEIEAVCNGPRDQMSLDYWLGRLLVHAAAVREAMGRNLLPELQHTYQRAIDDATMSFVDDEHEAHALALRAVERRVKAELMGGEK